MKLSTRKPGRQGLEVSAIGLGCMGMSQSYGPADERESIATRDRAIEHISPQFREVRKSR